MFRTRSLTRTAVAAAGLLALGVLGTACGDDSADADITDAPAATTTVAPATTTPDSAEHEGHDTTVPPATQAPAPEQDAPTTTEPVTTEPAAPAVVEVRSADYGFGGLPAEVPAGTSFTLVNDSTVEVHEIVAVRLPDTETRSVHEIVQAQDMGAIFAGGMPQLVIVAGPNGGEPIVAEGDGTLTEPGRYAVLCFIPTGADPQEYFEAAQAGGDGPPQVDGGAPHFAHGMYAEMTVTP
jgi:hypothetical protein